MNILDQSRPKEHATWWRVPDPGGPELLQATFRTRTFARHAHDRFAIGIIEAGSLAFRYRGQRVLAPAGWVNLAFPGEPHCGQPADAQGWTYRMFYLEPDWLYGVARELDPTIQELPFVPAGAVWDPELAKQILELHRLCETPTADSLERQCRLVSLVQDVLQRHSVAPGERLLRRVRGAVEIARNWIEEAFETSIQLEQLAVLSGMNPFRLVRSFTQTLGLPPHAYLVQVRLRRAADLLRQGVAPARAAVEVGFSDQSHLNRHFRRAFGITPGVYQRAFVPFSGIRRT